MAHKIMESKWKRQENKDVFLLLCYIAIYCAVFALHWMQPLTLGACYL